MIANEHANKSSQGYLRFDEPAAVAGPAGMDHPCRTIGADQHMDDQAWALVHSG